MPDTATMVLAIEGQDKTSKMFKDIEKGVGGIGKAFQDVGKIAGGFLAANVIAGGVGKLTGLIGDSIGAMKESIAVGAQLDAVITSTGGAAGVTANQVKTMAGNMEKLSLFEDEAIISSSSLLLTFTNIGKDVFPRAQQAVIDMSQALGQDLKSSSVQLGKALNDPINGITALSRVGVSFTEDQKKVIESMVEAGDVAGAQALILQELEKEFGGSAKAASDAAGANEKYKDKMNDLKEMIGAKVLPVQELWMKAQIIGLTFLTDQLIPTLEELYAKHWPAVSKVLSDVATTVTGTLWPAFQTGMDTVYPLVKGFVGFILDNEILLIAAISAIGVAIVLALGPISGAALALGGIITSIGLVKDNWQELKNFMENPISVPEVKVGGQGLGGSTLKNFLGKLGVPGYAVGTPFVPQDTLAMVHKGEAIIPAAANPFTRGTQAASGATPTIIIQGDIYGWDDFVRKVGAANVEGARRGMGYGVAR
jgi:hypothetical protein